MTKKIFTALFSMVIFSMVNAQEAAPSPFKLNGSLDAYYRWSPGAQGSYYLNNFTSFTNSDNTFQLGMPSLKGEYSKGKAGAVIDLGFGPRAKEFAYADEGILQSVKQAYAYFSPCDKVKFTAGKFATHIGYELLDPQLNKNYSMSYMFTNGPFSHTGLKADVTLGKGFAAMLGVANPIDVTAPSSGSAPKTILAQLSKTTSKASVYLNYAGYFGAKDQMPNASSLNQVDLTASYTVNDKFGLGYDGTVQFVRDEVLKSTKSWWGSALYLNYSASNTFGLALRTEYFSDKKYGVKAFNLGNGIFQGADIFAATLSGNYKVGGLMLIPELRIDNANTQIFSKNENGDPTKTAFSALLAAVYSF